MPLRASKEPTYHQRLVQTDAMLLLQDPRLMVQEWGPQANENERAAGKVEVEEAAAVGAQAGTQL